MRLSQRKGPFPIDRLVANLLFVAGYVLSSGPSRVAAQPSEIVIQPNSVTLRGNFARAQLLVRQGTSDTLDPRASDLTGQATFGSSNAQVVAVSNTGQMYSIGNGVAEVTAIVDGRAVSIPVQVEQVESEPQIDFTRHVIPILSKAGCNAGACHASQYGKGGFKLSVFGFAPDEDYRAMIQDGHGRRIDRLVLERSLLLAKPTMTVPHGGRKRLSIDSADYHLLRAWIAAQGTRGLPAAPLPADKSVKLTGLQVHPVRRIGAPGFTQQLRVVAQYSDGQESDVTGWARFDSLDDSVLAVNGTGMVSTKGHGETAVMVRFGDQATLAQFTVPYGESPRLTEWSDENVVDRLAVKKFRELGLTPSPLCDDATFMRRVFLDVLGSLPTVEEAKTFLANTNPDRRAALIDEVLGLNGQPSNAIYRQRYGAYWGQRWADLLRCSSSKLGEQGMWALHNWLQASFRDNKPLDQFTRELLTASGSVFSVGPANYYRAASGPEELAETTAQVFLGTRLQCAKCHHHPYETLGQDDYYGFAAYFARVATKGTHEFGVFGGESVIYVRTDGEVTHPKSGQVLAPKPLAAIATESTETHGDRRDQMSTWLTGASNRLFARNIVNRYFAFLMGRGLVEPVDDLRNTNPASNSELLDGLTDKFIQDAYDVKQLLRTVMTSRLYQLDSRPLPENAADQRFYSHYNTRRMAAEPLLDAVDQVCGIPTKFRNVPLGTRAIELPDAEYPDPFLKAFGKPRRASVCECERTNVPNLAQALHMLNGEILAGKVSHAEGRIAKLVAAGTAPDDILAELFVAALGRRPHDDELAVLRQSLQQAADPRPVYEDVLWALLNSKQFQYVR